MAQFGRDGREHSGAWSARGLCFGPQATSLSAFADRGRDSAIDFALGPAERERASLPPLGASAARDYRQRAPVARRGAGARR